LVVLGPGKLLQCSFIYQAVGFPLRGKALAHVAEGRGALGGEVEPDDALRMDVAEGADGIVPADRQFARHLVLHQGVRIAPGEPGDKGRVRTRFGAGLSDMGCLLSFPEERA
jgi:hypothetical protein